MVTSLLVVGLNVRLLEGVEAEIGHAATAEEAFASLSRRGWDVVLAGNVPDAAAEVLVSNLSRRYPSTPVVLLSDDPSAGARGAAWEVVARSGAAAMADVVRRAAEVARLRREVARLATEREDRPEHGDLARTFERGTIHEMERLMIMERLARMNQNRTHSAASLEISVRTLRNKLREYRESERVMVDSGEAR